jgi:hypothetical protein
MTNHEVPPSGSSCWLSCRCGPFLPPSPPPPLAADDILGDRDREGGGGVKRVGSLVVLRGREVRASGRGIDSTRVIFSRGRAERREAGRSAGEQARMMWRRCTLDVKKDMFSVVDMSVSDQTVILLEEVYLPLTFLPELPSLAIPVSIQSKLVMRPQKPVAKARSAPRFLTLSCRTR